MRDLNENRGHLRRAQAAQVHTAALVVVDLAQQPANSANWSADEARGGEVAAYGRRPHAKVQGVPIS